MLRAYGPNCDGSIIDAAKGQRIPDDATWIDLEEPTREEDKLVEECVRVQVPTREDMSEIEPSSRLYERNGTLYMTLGALYGVEDGHPRSDPIGFVLTDNRVVTVRYVTPKPIRSFQNHARTDKALVKDALTATYGLLDSIIDRLADCGADAKPALPALKKLKFSPDDRIRECATAAVTKIERAAAP